MKRLIVPFELKKVGDRELEGYGSTFGNVDLGGDVVIEGAFAKSLARHRDEGTRPKMLWNHDTFGLPIGVWNELKEDSNGLWLKGALADTQVGNDVRTLAKMGAIDSMSIGYTIADAEFRKDGVLMLKELDLWEVSLVNFPMNPQAVIAAVKSQIGDPRVFERNLRDAGHSQRSAKRLISDLMGTTVTAEPGERDVDEVDEELIAELKAREESLLAGLINSRMRRYA